MDNASSDKPSYCRPSWDEYFMNIVEIIGSRGTCDRGRTGCLITKEKRIISTGYVGSPIGLPHCDDIGHEMHTVTHPDEHQTRHCIRTSHAEINAISQAARFGARLDGGTLYIKMTPCYTCAKMIINAGIARVVCRQDYHASQRSKEIFAEAGIQFKLLNKQMTLYDDMAPESIIESAEKNTNQAVKKEPEKNKSYLITEDIPL